MWAHIVLCNFIAYISMYDPHHRQDTSQVVPWLQENSLWPMIHPQSLAITNQFSIILSFPECYINGTTQLSTKKKKKKKMHNLNVENYVLFEDITIAWKTASRITLEEQFRRNKEGARIYKFFFFFFFAGKQKNQTKQNKQKKHVVKHRRLLLITKHIHLKLMILVLLYVWEDVRVSMCAKSLQSCPPLCNPIDCSLPGSSVHEILQAWRVEWVSRLITIIPLLFSLAI